MVCRPTIAPQIALPIARGDIATQWIAARTALEICGNGEAICSRSQAGLIRARAVLLNCGNAERRFVDLPSEFWPKDNQRALDQNWQTGDFATRIEPSEYWQAFGVRFDLEGLLTLMPPEEHASIRRQHSVAGNA